MDEVVKFLKNIYIMTIIIPRNSTRGMMKSIKDPLDSCQYKVIYRSPFCGKSYISKIGISFQLSMKEREVNTWLD